MTELLRSRKVAAGFVERQDPLLDGGAPRLRAAPFDFLAATTLRDLAMLLTDSLG
ncbi:MAG: hypothetical protein KDC87_16920 [Planctomycetes bacterium]|nr:hypothetical protein [Planctomycetota bacterium]MCB9870999.1 hypothetical protein [Planctomycetota bacterium]MCB9888359.1 hypothetical protein [Planctomycetota bacterium]